MGPSTSRLLPREVATLLVCMTLAASGIVVGATGASSAPEASEYLEKMAKAEHATYRARRLVVYLADPQSAAVLEIHSSADGTFVRAEAGTDVTRVWRVPGHGLTSGDAGSFEDAAPPAVPLRTDEVMDKYDVTLGEPTMMLGRSVVPLDLVRRADVALVERLWVDRETGIVYQRELFGPEGDMVGISTMLDMDWGEAGHTETYDGPETSKVVASASADAPERLAYGYRLVKGYRLEAEGRPADHWVYSDGFHTLSVFRTDGDMSTPPRFHRLDIEGREVWAGPGPGTWIWEGDSSTWVLVAEEPQLDVASLVAPFPSGGPSLLSRVGSWWAQAWHWLTDLVT